MAFDTYSRPDHLTQILLSYKTFENGSNSDRDDTTHNFSLKADYPLADSVDLGFFAAYTLRDSSDTANDYKIWIVGLD